MRETEAISPPRPPLCMCVIVRRCLEGFGSEDNGRRQRRRAKLQLGGVGAVGWGGGSDGDIKVDLETGSHAMRHMYGASMWLSTDAGYDPGFGHWGSTFWQRVSFKNSLVSA